MKKIIVVMLLIAIIILSGCTMKSRMGNLELKMQDGTVKTFDEKLYRYDVRYFYEGIYVINKMTEEQYFFSWDTITYAKW